MTSDRLSLLLIDDQAFVGMILGRLLASETGIDLHCCHDAKEAIPLANRLRPSLIFQDLLLPDIDGVTLVRLFRRNPATTHTPIVVLSGNDDAETRERAAAAGADEYLVKLPDKSTLLACIARHARGRTTTADTTAADTRAAAAPDVTLDRSLIESLLAAGGPASHAVLVSVIDRFLGEAASLLERLGAAAREREAAGAVAAAHSLKGAALTIGARRLARLSAELEEGVLRDPSVLGDTPWCAGLDAEFGRVRAALTLEKQVRA